jgi:hypothetical protein
MVRIYDTNEYSILLFITQNAYGTIDILVSVSYHILFLPLLHSKNEGFCNIVVLYCK